MHDNSDRKIADKISQFTHLNDKHVLEVGCGNGRITSLLAGKPKLLVAIDPDATALSFFLSGDSYDQPMQITYRELISQINRTANLFHDLGIG